MMAEREICLAKDGHRYVFRFSSGFEGQILDEVSRMAGGQLVNLDWSDAAALGFQITQITAIECCAAMMLQGDVEPSARTSHERPHETGSGGDDAKDGPCTNTNYPW